MVMNLMIFIRNSSSCALCLLEQHFGAAGPMHKMLLVSQMILQSKLKHQVRKDYCLVGSNLGHQPARTGELLSGPKASR